MQFKYRNQFQFLSTVLALLEMAQSAMPERTTKTTGANTKQGSDEFSFQHCINIKRKQLRKYVVKFRKCLSKLRIPSRGLVTYQSEKNKHLFMLVIQVIEIRTKSCKTALLRNIYT